MKRRKMIHTKKRFYFGCITAFAAALSIAIYLHDTSDLVAKEDDGTPIVVDKNTEEKFELPYDAVSLIEDEIKALSPKFDDYVQDSSIKQIVEKNNIQAFRGENSDYWNNSLGKDLVYRLENGNYLMTSIDANGMGTRGSSKTMLYLDVEGNLLDYIYEPTNPEETLSVANRFIGFLGSAGENAAFVLGNTAANDQLMVTYKVYIDENDKLQYEEVSSVNTRTEFNISSIGTTGYTNDLGEKVVTSSSHTATSNSWGLTRGKLSLIAYDGDNQLYRYRELDNELLEEVFPEGTVMYGNRIVSLVDVVKRDDMLISQVRYSNGGTTEIKATYLNSIQIFSEDTGELIETAYLEEEPLGNSMTMQILHDLSTDDEIYFFSGDSTGEIGSKIMKYDLTKPLGERLSTVKEYAPKTTLLIQKNAITGEIFYFGYTEKMSGAFEGFQGNDDGNVVVGAMDEQFTILTASSLASDGSVDFVGAVADGVDEDNNTTFMVLGYTTASNFTEAAYPSQEENELGPEKLFFGSMKSKRDYSPIISSSESIFYDLDKVSQSPEVKDLELLAGNSSLTPISVFDMFDSNSSNIEEMNGQDWLNGRINRNPNAPTNDIDWSALGFEDDGKVGANRVTYFITDSQKQTTSTSRIVNKVDSHTVVNKEGALAAYNFAITLDELVNLTDESLRNSDKYANLTAWDLDTGESILSLPANEGIEIDADQLADIKAATEFGVYPLTFKMNYGEEYKEVAISVFVSRYEPIDDYVYDLEPISMPWDVSKDISGEDYPNSEFSKEGINVYTAYKVSTGEKIDENNPNYQLIGDVTNLNACDPNPNDYTATKAVKVPVSIWTRGATPTKEVDLPNTPDTTVYYRTEDIKVSFVDWNFATLYDVEGNQLQAAGVTLPNQIVGKNTAIKTNAQVVAAIETILLKGYEKEDYYLEDKTAKLTTDSVLVELNNGDGATYYLRFKGLLEIISVPTVDFGLHNTATAWGGSLREDDPDVTGSLIISDTRADTTKNWTLKAELSEPLTSLDGSVTIPDAIRYKRSGQSEFVLSTDKQIMMTNDAGTFGTFDVSETWGSTKDSDGFKFEAPAAKVKKLTKYQATIKYTLSDTYEP